MIYPVETTNNISLDFYAQYIATNKDVVGEVQMVKYYFL